MITSTIGELGSRRGILRSLLFVGVSEASAKVGLVVATLIVARSLGAQEFGRWSFAIAITGVFAMLSDAGMTAAVQRRLAIDADGARALVGNAIALRLVTAAAGYAMLVAVALASGKPSELVLLLLLLGAAATATQFTLFVQGIFRALACSQFDAATRCVQQALLIGPVIVIALAGGSTLAFGIAFSLAAGVMVLVTLALLRSRVAATPRFALREWRSLGAEAWPFWLSGMMWIAYFRIDVVILSYFSTDQETGLYNMAYNGFQAFTLPGAMLVAALFPSFAHLRVHDPERFLYLRTHALRTAMLVAVVVAGAAAFAAAPGVAILLGESYAGSVTLFRILAVALVFVYGNYVMYQSLSAAEHSRLVAGITGCGAALNIALNLTLVPRLDATGAALSTLATEATLFVLLVACSRWSLRSITLRSEPMPLPAPGRMAA